MMSLREKNQQRLRRVARVRAKIEGTAERPRLSVHRSLAHVSAQLIDDTVGKTLVAVADTEIADAERKGKKKTEIAMLVGKLIAERAKAKGITKVVFDRRDKQYHGRVAALAQAAREGGLIF